MTQFIFIAVILLAFIGGVVTTNFLKKKYKQFIQDQYNKMNNPPPKKDLAVSQITSKNLTIVGESKFNLSQPRTHTANLPENEKEAENSDTFVEPTSKDDHLKSINVDLTMEQIEVPEDDIELSTTDLNEEEDFQEAVEGDVTDDSGVSAENLTKAFNAIANYSTTNEKAKQEVGKILHENSESELLEQLMNNEKTKNAVTALIGIHLHEMKNNNEIIENQQEEDPFNIDDFIP